MCKEVSLTHDAVSGRGAGAKTAGLSFLTRRDREECVHRSREAVFYPLLAPSSGAQGGPEDGPRSPPAPCSAPAGVHCPVYSSQPAVMLPRSENYGPLGATRVFPRLSCKTEKPPCPASSPTPPSLSSTLGGGGGVGSRCGERSRRQGNGLLGLHPKKEGAVHSLTG